MSSHTHPRLEQLYAVAEAVGALASDAARASARKIDARKPRSRRGGTLRPSVATPLWNALATLVQAHLQKRGDRALLARELDVHRARIGEFFDRKSSMPDAERTLELLIWLSRQSGQADGGRGRK